MNGEESTDGVKVAAPAHPLTDEQLDAIAESQTWHDGDSPRLDHRRFAREVLAAAGVAAGAIGVGACGASKCAKGCADPMNCRRPLGVPVVDPAFRHQPRCGARFVTAGECTCGVAEDPAPDLRGKLAPPTAQEDQWLHDAAKRSGTVVAPGKLAPKDGVTAAPAPAAKPPYSDSFGYTLAMRVMQSGLYLQLHGLARDECDEMVRRGQTPSVAIPLNDQPKEPK